MTQFQGIQAVFFDLDNTLYEYLPANTAGIKAAHKLLSKYYAVSYTEFCREYKRAEERNLKLLAGLASCHSRLLRFQQLLESHGIFDPALALALEEAFWNAYIPAMKIEPTARKTIQTLKSRGYAIGLITDLTARVQFTKLTRHTLASLFGAIVTSDEVGHEKPHRAPFVAALAKLGVSAKHSVMIGDNPRNDMLGAKRMGMKTILFLRDDMKHIKGPKPDAKITKLSQVLTYL